MDICASAITDSLACWSQAREVAFGMLVKWIKKETYHNVQRFDNDNQDSDPQGLFKILDCSWKASLNIFFIFIVAPFVHVTCVYDLSDLQAFRTWFHNSYSCGGG